ncbi:hypothetical protein KKF05_01335 [Patescibacteria group bacterium]|nr:hypothetical protein [Patescibacteria group bacterium]MBU1028912.1 hypothetical protein [Patescibacteria group bacterium]MBU1916151.1 hypothetical protein [Patescibacteria group bacterium]
MTKTTAKSLLTVALILLAVTVFVFFSVDEQEPVSGTASDDVSLVNYVPEQEIAGPEARNRIWRLFNNGCRRNHSETALELNICRSIRRQTQRSVRQQALLNLRSMGAIQFEDYQLSTLIRGLESAPADNVIMVTRRIAAPGPLGQFVLELTDDRPRMRLFLNSQRITLE